MLFAEYYALPNGCALRAIALADVPQITSQRIFNRRHLKFLPWIKTLRFTEDETRLYVQCKRDAWDANQEWTFSILADGEVVGDFQVRRTKIPTAIEFGYWLDIRHRGRGIMTHAVETICAAATRIGFTTAVIITHKRNKASAKVAIRAQFAQEINNINEYNTVANRLTFTRSLIRLT